MGFHKHFLTLLTTFIIIYKQIKCEKDLEIKMLLDFINYEEIPIRVTALLCWNREELNKFSNMVFNENIHLSVLNTDKPVINIDLNDAYAIFIIDINCEHYLNILVQANNENLYKIRSKWLLISDHSYILDGLQTELMELNIFMDSDMILAQKNNDTQFILTEIYRFAPYRKELVQNVVMNWDESGKFGEFRRRRLATGRRNLNSTVIRSCVVFLSNDTLQNNHFTDYRNKHVDSISKLNNKFITQLIDFTNTTYVYYPVTTWGFPDKPNVYNGMLGSMQRHEIEIGGSALYMTKERLKIVDYIGMTTPTKLRFIFRSPPLSYQSNIFTLPFTSGLWLSSFVLVILIIVLLYFAVYMEWCQPEIADSPNDRQTSFMEVVMIIMAAIGQQGATREPRGSAGRLIMFLGFIVLMFLYVSYAANIVALLQSSADNIRTLEDLLESRLQVGAEDNVYNHYYLETATEPTKKALYQKKVAPPGRKTNFLPLAEGTRRIREGFFAFHAEVGPCYKMISDTFFESEKCGLKELAFNTFSAVYLPITKNSPYTEIFKIGLQKIHESGLRHCEVQRIYTKKPECSGNAGSFVSVGLIDSYPAFLFLLVGIGFAFVLFLLEIIAYKKGIHCR